MSLESYTRELVTKSFDDIHSDQWDYAAGLFDADGCGRRKDNPNKITSGSLPLLEQIQQYLYSEGINSVIHIQCGRTYCINIKRSSDVKFFQLLYSNATIYMHRKYNRVSHSAIKIG